MAQQARAAGVGTCLDTEVGGKSDPVQGPPVRMHAVVQAVSDGAFTYDGPMFAGLTGNMGPSETAHRRSGIEWISSDVARFRR